MFRKYPITEDEPKTNFRMNESKFTTIRKEVDETALKNIPSLFAGMNFKETASYFVSNYHANGEQSKDKAKQTTTIYKNSGAVQENGRDTMIETNPKGVYTIYDLFVTQNNLTPKTWESLERYAEAVGVQLPDDEELEADRRKRMEADKQRQQIESDVNRYVANRDKTNGTKESADFWLFTNRRGWNLEYLERFRIGFDDKRKDYPVVIPVPINGRTAFIVRRNFDKSGKKYENPKGEGILNGFGFADPNAKEIFICEGIPDAMALNFFGFAGACCFSANINNAQKDDVKRRMKRGLKNVFLVADNDPAGKQATERNGAFLSSCGLDVRVITFTDVKDVDEYFFKANKKKEDFEELKSNATTFAVYMQRAKREEYQQTKDLNQYFDDVARIYNEAKPADKMAISNAMEENASADGYKYELFTEYTKKKEAEGVANNAQTPTADDTIKQKASQLFKPYETGDVFKMASHFEPEINTGYMLATMDDQKHAQKWTIPADDLTLICGYTSHGKSKVLQNLFLKLAYDPTEKGRFIFVSYEEGKGAILRQFVNIHINNDLRDNEQTNVEAIGKYLLNTGAKSCNGHADKIKNTLNDLDVMGISGRIYIEETNASTTTEVLAEALRQQIERYKDSATPVRAVFIDYVQLLTLEDGAKLTPMIVLKDVALILHGLAKDTQTAIICGAQLQREKSEQNPIYINESNVADSSYLERTSAEVVIIYDGNKLQYREFAQIKQSADGKALLNEGQKALFTKGFAQPTNNAERLEAGGRMYVKICKHRGNVANVEGVLKYTPATGRIDNLPADVWASPSWKNYADAMQIPMQAPATDDDEPAFKPIANNKNELPF